MRLIVSHTIRYGGITTSLFSLLEVLKITKYDILVVDKNINYTIIDSIKEKYECRILYFPSKKSHSKNIMFERFFQAVFLRKIIKKENIEKVIFSDWNLVLDWFAHTTKSSYLVFVHTYPNRELSKIVKVMINFLLKKTLVTTVSEFSKRKIISNWKIDESNIDVLYNYSHFFGISYKNKKNRDTKKVITIAHCELYKNPRDWYNIALSTIEKSGNIEFHWYGDGTLYEEFKKLTEHNNKIFFHGYNSSIENILLNENTIYLQCSLVESLGISILDAMNYSIPVIVLDNGGMPELIINEKSGFICTTNEEIVNKILLLSNDFNIFQAMSIESKLNYETQFTKELWVEKINKIL